MNGNNTAAMNQMVNGTNGASRGSDNIEELKIKLNTCIYDYFLRNGEYDLARTLKNSKLQLTTTTNKPAAQRKVNGEEGEDVKDDFDGKKLGDLPYPHEIPQGPTDNSFLLDWFQIFWEMFFATRKNTLKIGGATAAYMQYQRDQQLRMNQNGMPNGMMGNYPAIMRGAQPGMGMNRGNIAHNPQAMHLNSRMMMNRVQQQQQQQQQAQQQQAMMQNPSQMAREGSDVEMTDAGMLAQNQFNNFQGPNQKKLDAYSQNLAQQVRQNMPANMPGQMMPNQGVPNEEFYGAGGNNPMRGGMPQVGGAPPGGNHALQDYQMQLMLLEQQNKKRLLMARQEQDQVRPGENGMGPQAGFAPNMSPSQSQSGRSPNPSDQMRKGTPKLNQVGLPGGPNSPMPESNMAHARASPGAMGYNMEMMQAGMKGVEGMPLGPGMRPPSSHPGFPGNGVPMSQAQMEALRNGQAGVRLPNGAAWPGMPQGQAPGMPQGVQPGQQIGTPQARNVAMPPPQNVPGQNGVNGRPTSPTQSVTAGTPQPANKAAPAKKGKAAKENKKQPAKKGAAAATPSADDNPPQTPTPATPSTPMHPDSFKNGKGVNGAGQLTSGQMNANVPATAAHIAQGQQDGNMIEGFDAMVGIDHNPMTLEFSGMDGGDVLQEFDFDAFLDTGDPNDPMNNFTDIAYPSFDGLEASTGDA